MKQVLENHIHIERLFGHLEQRQTDRHIRNAIKECLLASRSVIDSVIDTLEEEPSAPAARKIKISNECTDSGVGK